MVYLPTFGWLFMVNVGKYTTHGWYGYKDLTIEKLIPLECCGWRIGGSINTSLEKKPFFLWIWKTISNPEFLIDDFDFDIGVCWNAISSFPQCILHSELDLRGVWIYVVKWYGHLEHEKGASMDPWDLEGYSIWLTKISPISKRVKTEKNSFSEKTMSFLLDRSC